MHVLPTKVDFYITNVCNLTCDRCNRFNNHNFKGWQNWTDYQAQYQQWGQLVSLKAATIMGGEPFLNPSLSDWISGINQIFGIEVQVLTNGTRFRQSKSVYNTFLYKSQANQHQNHIGVSLHTPDEFEVLRQDILYFLEGPVQEYPKEHPKNRWNSDWQFIDTNGVLVNVYISNNFGAAAIKPVWRLNGGQQKKFLLHNSNPEVAHNSCAFAQFKSYHFIRGRLYKCGPVALMPEFDQQHSLEISEQDRILLNSYRALGTDNFDHYHEEFFANLDKPIAQCKFCPENFDPRPIFPVRKGSVT